ncbi:MAG: hypothetical protein NTV80_00215, partial [Verrucomicrobia bacterium]|nr:hypothetical protein [Verrucomicrobiota bacterium]
TSNLDAQGVSSVNSVTGKVGIIGADIGPLVDELIAQAAAAQAKDNPNTGGQAGTAITNGAKVNINTLVEKEIDGAIKYVLTTVIDKAIALAKGETVLADELEFVITFLKIRELFTKQAAASNLVVDEIWKAVDALVDAANRLLDAVDIFDVIPSIPKVPKPSVTVNETVSFRDFTTGLPMDATAVNGAVDNATSVVRVLSIAAGGDHNVVLLENGKLVSWGRNDKSQLGHKDTTSLPVRIIKEYLGIKVIDRNVPLEVNTSEDTSALFGKPVRTLVAGGDHTLALCDDDQGTLVAWGDNQFKQLGRSDGQPRRFPTVVAKNGALSGRTVIAITAGYQHNFALCSDGTLVSWGGNTSGQFGNNSVKGGHLPVAANLQFGTSALYPGDVFRLSSGSTSNHSAALFVPPPVLQKPTQREISGYESVLGASVMFNGGSRMMTEEVWIAKTAENPDPRNTAHPASRRIGVPAPINPVGGPFTTVVSGLELNTEYSYASAALNGAGAAHQADSLDRFPYVYSPVGTFLTSDLPRISSPTFTAIQGAQATLGGDVTFDGRTDLKGVGVVVDELVKHAATTSEDGRSVVFTTHPRLGGSGVKQFSAAFNSTGMFTVDATGLKSGTTYCYAAYATNVNGTVYTSTGIFSTRLKNEIWTLSSAQPEATVMEKDAVISPGSRLTLSLGYEPVRGATLTLIRNTGLGFIQGEFENLRHGEEVTLTHDQRSYHYVAWYYSGEGHNDLVLIPVGQTPVGWGNSSSGQLGNNGAFYVPEIEPLPAYREGVLKDRTVVQLALGGAHALALLDDGTIAAWGSNGFGQLGDGTHGTDENKKVPVLVSRAGGSALNGVVVVAVAAGKNHSLALFSDGRIAAWGDNANGQLGD